MSRTRIKICGINTPQAALAAAEAGADAIGFVFVEKSPRFVTLQQAKQIIHALPAFVQPVGLFADQPLDHIRHVTQELGLHIIQLHGSESHEFVQQLEPLAVIKAVAFEHDSDTAQLDAWRKNVSNIAAVLIDAPPPANANITGGHGLSFDWQAMADSHGHQGRAAGSAPIIIAGGLTPHNVAQAIRTLEPYALDVSSGVESSRGVKDPEKIKAFCKAVQKTDASRL